MRLYGTRKRAEPGVHVGAGIGAAVMPLRLAERGQREVAMFELGSEPGSFDEHHAELVPHQGRTPSPEILASRTARVARNRERRARPVGQGKGSAGGGEP
ncbi:hypothetical protein [Sorangium sp. So ce887]|uniref:hypothetical protein n=1 Tax=Sorangium sp. So ce887 TaxID=3133324 RepID=UPI003F5EAA32